MSEEFDDVKTDKRRHDWVKYPNCYRIKKKYMWRGCELKIESRTNRVIYAYKVDGGMHFAFDLLCEVGQRYQPIFNSIIKENNLTIELYDNPEDTYCHGYYERLVKEV